MSLLYFIIAISILVVIHEYGHFWVARRCGVRVLRFSVGFGKPLFGIRDKSGTEYSIAPLPLGGYVKMLDEREGPVPEQLRAESFNSKTPGQKIAIAAAGPIANFIFAVLAYWVLFVSGTQGIAPVVGEVKVDSPAYVAGVEPGDEIISIAGELTPTLEDVSWRLISYLGESASIPVMLQREGASPRLVNVVVEEWLASSEQPDPISGLGIKPKMLHVPAVVGRVVEHSPADIAGLATGDEILQVNGNEIEDWYQLVSEFKQSPGRSLLLSLARAEKVIEVAVTPQIKVLDDGSRIGFAGIAAAQPEVPADWLRTRNMDVVGALGAAGQKTWELVVFTLDSLWKMLAGDLSVKNLSGPITIAKVAGASASGGLEAFVQFLALLSVSLGVLNLLPVPMLDGGHIVFNLIEAIRGKEVPEQIQLKAMQAGMFLLLGLMAVAFYNDIARL